jgi:uncharacterized membrane protein YfcA
MESVELMIGLALILGVFVGSLQAFLGLGGAILAIPILTFGFGFEIQQAMVASLVVVLIASLVGVIPKFRTSSVDIRVGLTMVVLAIPSSFLGAWLAPIVPEVVLELSFAAVVFLSAGLAIRRPRAAEGFSPGWAILIPVSLLVGFLAGFLGVGGGIIAVPALLVAFRFPIDRAAATALFTVLLNSTVASIAHLPAWPSIQWQYPLIIAGSAAAASLLLAGTARKTNPTVTRYLLVGLLVAIGIAMLLSAFLG